jgi:aspartate/tyrosine/aromatic aminotransferase
MSTGKGVKRTKNNPVFYAELKKGHEIFLTDSSWLKVKELAKKNGLSVSEYIERLIRKLDITVG